MSLINEIEEIRTEHKILKSVFIKLDHFIDNLEIVDVPELKLKIDKFSKLWNAHEIKEDKLFENLKVNGDKVKIDLFLTEHEELKSHFESIKSAISSLDNEKIKNTLKGEGHILIKKFNEHINSEEKFLECL